MLIYFEMFVYFQFLHLDPTALGRDEDSRK